MAKGEGTESGNWLQKIEWKRALASVRVRLIAAFAVVAAMTVLAAGVAVFGFENLRVAMSGIANESVPAMKSASHLQVQSVAIAAAAPTCRSGDQCSSGRGDSKP